MTRYWLGIDPGITGALALLDEQGEAVELIDMPGNVADLADWIWGVWSWDTATEHQIQAVVEIQSAYPKQGVVSSFKTGKGYGEILGCLAALRIPYRLVAPGTWKRAMGVSADKEQARAKARERWPTASLSRKKDHGRAEALLLAEYLRRQENASK